MVAVVPSGIICEIFSASIVSPTFTFTLQLPPPLFVTSKKVTLVIDISVADSSVVTVYSD